MLVNNKLLDFGLLMNWGYSNFLNNMKKKEDIVELKNMIQFLKDNKEYFQFYQIQGLIHTIDYWKGLSCNKKLPFYSEMVQIFDDFSDYMFKGSVYLYLKKEKTEDRKSFEILNKDIYQSLLKQAFLYSQSFSYYLDFVVPEYFSRNKNNIDKEIFTFISNYLKATPKAIMKDKWFEIL